MISNTNNSILSALSTQGTGQIAKTTGQNMPGAATSAQEQISEKGFKQYIRDLQMEKLEEKARAYAMRKMNMTEEKLEKIEAASPQKYGEITQNIQDYISDFLTQEAKLALDKEAQDQGLPGYNKGMLVDLSA